MGDPTNTTQYPAFSGTTGKRDMLRELIRVKDHGGESFMAVVAKIANTDLDALTDKSTVYIPNDSYNAAS